MRRQKTLTAKKRKEEILFVPVGVVVGYVYSLAFQDGYRSALMTLGRLGEEGGGYVKGRGESRTEAGWMAG